MNKQADKNADRAALRGLSEKLRVRGLPSQSTLAKACNVYQGLVSRAANGALKRVTERVRRLDAYVNMRISELSGDGAGDGRSRGVSVLKQCERYLDEGFDPTLLFDQVMLLRRAQAKSMSERRGGTD